MITVILMSQLTKVLPDVVCPYFAGVLMLTTEIRTARQRLVAGPGPDKSCTVVA